MEPTAASPKSIRFGVFEADLAGGELRKRGRKIPLQDQPFQVLALLLKHPGEIVTREELQNALWPAGTFVEFEHGVNTAIKKLRQALGDSADNPRFIETLPRKGYRFIAPVEDLAAPAPAPAPVRPVRRRWAWVLAPIALVVIAISIWLLNRPGRAADPVLVPLTSYPGEEVFPSFSPDGTQVAFEWCPEAPGPHCDIYIKQIGFEARFQLTESRAESFSPAWSPDGQTIAFLRNVTPTRVALILIPHRKGPERVLAQFDAFARKKEVPGPYLAWTRDSKSLVCGWIEGSQSVASLFLVSVDTGEKRRLTTPSVDASGDTSPAFSPDGRTLAFIRVAGWNSDLYLLRLAAGYMPQGEPERIAVGNPVMWGAAWTPDGSEIVFASGPGLSPSLWRMAASKSAKPRRLAFGSDRAYAPAVSRQGNRLAYVAPQYNANIWRVELNGPGQKPGVPVKFISSTQWERDPAYSPDGKRITFLSYRSGAPEIWVCDSDGSNPVKLTSLRGTDVVGGRWSPDGQSIAFTAFPPGNEDIYVISANGGTPRRLTTNPALDKWPYWSRDGQWIYFCSRRTGVDEIWKIPSAGGEEVQITRNGGDFPQESPDGRFVYYEKGWPYQGSVWRMPVEGGAETKVLDSVHPSGMWIAGTEGIYFFTVPDVQGRSEIRLYDFASGKTRKILAIERPVAHHIAVSPDGRSILYAQLDQAGSDLMLVENFR